jgi:hypothetical protein
MATKIYDIETIMLTDGKEVVLTPLKIKYLREFMEIFEGVKKSSNDDEAIQFLLDCALVAMKQYCPSIKTPEQLEDSINLPAIYRIIDIAAGIKVSEENQKETIKDQATESGSTWESLDLAKLESEVFLLGIWKDYEELEISLSMPELVATLGSKRELDYNEKKFLAAIQGVDLDKQSGKEEGNAWEKMKAKVFSGGKSNNPNDVLALQGVGAQKAGFGINMGLSYEDLTKK